MLLLTLALAQDCSVETAVSGFPLGSVPVGAEHTVVATTDCEGLLAGQLRVSNPAGTVFQSQTLTPLREGEFATFTFVVQDPPWNAELFFELEVNVEGEPKLILGGWYEVDPDVEEDLRGLPELSDVDFEIEGTEVSAVATVFPATNGPEAMFRWFGDGDLLAVTVSTQPRPRLDWVREDLQTPPCIRVEEVGYDGAILSSDPRCASSTEPTGCGCTTPTRQAFLGLGWIARR